MAEAVSPRTNPGFELPEPKDTGQVGGKLEPRAGLSLSAGGSRAMLFHVGALCRLRKMSLLPGLKCISSISGRSIRGDLLGLRGTSAMRRSSKFTPEAN